MKPGENLRLAVSKQRLQELRQQIGERVPLSCRYTVDARPILLSVDAGYATLRYPNGVTILNVPIDDLVDDGGEMLDLVQSPQS